MDQTIILLAAPLILAEFIMKVVALLSLRKQEHTRGPKLFWVLIILLISFFGWIAYFVLGRQEA